VAVNDVEVTMTGWPAYAARTTRWHVLAGLCALGAHFRPMATQAEPGRPCPVWWRREARRGLRQIQRYLAAHPPVR
jgi:hypothetical protein